MKRYTGERVEKKLSISSKTDNSSSVAFCISAHKCPLRQTRHVQSWLPTCRLARLVLFLTDLARFCSFELLKWAGGKKVHHKEYPIPPTRLHKKRQRMSLLCQFWKGEVSELHVRVINVILSKANLVKAASK